MLTESMRIPAGLQESKNIENPIPKMLADDQQHIINEQQRLIDEQKTVVTHFNIFQHNMMFYQDMIQNINMVFENNNKKEFVSGLYDSKYKHLQHFADIVINDDITTSLTYLDTHYYAIKNDVDTILRVNEVIEETNKPTFFVSKHLVTNDIAHGLHIPIFKYHTLEEKVSNEIPYGAEIILISENLTVVRHSGKQFYTRFTNQQISILEKKGFLM